MIYENHIKTRRETKTGQPFFFTFPPWAAFSTDWYSEPVLNAFHFCNRAMGDI
jgi:hypothetical protein